MRLMPGYVFVFSDEEIPVRSYQGMEHVLKVLRYEREPEGYLHGADLDFARTICELDGTWNCQLTANYRAFSYLRGVKILHYLSLQPEGIYRLNRDELMTSELTDSQIEELIDRPEQHFLRFYFYAEDSVDNRIMLGSHYHLIRRIFTRRPKLYRFGEKFFSRFRK